MNDLVLGAGGRFYLAKDSTLRKSDLKTYMGEPALEAFRAARKEFDPAGILTNDLGIRLGLV
jgi:decaprenylphospho-beta-D-ribofuranose 2-oxidase